MPAPHELGRNVFITDMAIAKLTIVVIRPSDLARYLRAPDKS
jgi:hypothetical protein